MAGFHFSEVQDVVNQGEKSVPESRMVLAYSTCFAVRFLSGFARPAGRLAAAGGGPRRRQSQNLSLRAINEPKGEQANSLVFLRMHKRVAMDCDHGATGDRP